MRPWAVAALALGAVALSGAAAWWVGGRFDPDSDQRVLARDGASLLSQTFPTADGTPYPLSTLRGKVAVVNFWATWCAPCREEMPAFSRLNDQFSSNGVQFVGIGIDSADKVGQFAKEFAVSYPLVVGNVTAIDLSRDFGNSVQALPFTVVLDRDGRVAATRLGRYDEADLSSTLKRLL